MVFADLPAVDDRFEGGAMCGEVESTKSVSESIARCWCGRRSTVQDDHTFELCPYGDGWMIEPG